MTTPTTTVEVYRVRDLSMECTCERCGCPLYVDDNVFAVLEHKDAWERAYCSRYCAELDYGTLPPRR